MQFYSKYFLLIKFKVFYLVEWSGWAEFKFDVLESCLNDVDHSLSSIKLHEQTNCIQQSVQLLNKLVKWYENDALL